MKIQRISKTEWSFNGKPVTGRTFGRAIRKYFRMGGEVFTSPNIRQYLCRKGDKSGFEFVG